MVPKCHRPDVGQSAFFNALVTHHVMIAEQIPVLEFRYEGLNIQFRRRFDSVIEYDEGGESRGRYRRAGVVLVFETVVRFRAGGRLLRLSPRSSKPSASSRASSSRSICDSGTSRITSRPSSVFIVSRFIS